MANTVINTPELLNLDSTTGATVLAKGTVNERPPSPTFSVNYLVVAGGGGGGGGQQAGGGGGAGGYRSSVAGESSGGNTSAETPLALTKSTNYAVTVGEGGAGGSSSYGGNGTNSVFSTIISTGGGGGGTGSSYAGQDGGSGGGASDRNGQNGGTAVTSPVTQGFSGANITGLNSSYRGGSGGGGAGQAGQLGTYPGGGYTGVGGDGGDGLASSITGTSTYRAGGGAGGSQGTSVQGIGGQGGGGNGETTSNNNGSSGTPNTGGGGGGSNYNSSFTGYDGGSGIVIVRYPNAYDITVGSGLTTGTLNTAVGSNEKYTTFTAGTGTISFSGTVVGDENKATDGTLRFNTDTNKTEYFDGTGWYEIVDEYASGFIGPGTNYFDTKLYTGNGVTQSIGGYINGSGSFNGSSSRITLPIGSPFNDSNTIKAVSAWIKAGTSTSRVYPLSISSTSNANDYWYIGYMGDLNAIYIATRDGSSSNQSIAYATITPDTGWHHIVVQLTATGKEIYLDGISQTVINSNSGTATNTSWISYPSYSGTVQGAIGVLRLASISYGQGSIDQVRVYDTVLSSADVTALYGETAATASTAAFPPGQTAIATYTMDTSANGLLNTQDLSTVDYPSGAGCIALYEMNGNSNDTSNTYNGTPTNITYQGGAFDQAAVFNGSSSLIKDVLGSGFTYAGKTMTFSAWIFVTDNTNDNVIIGDGFTTSQGGWAIATGYGNAPNQRLSFSVASSAMGGVQQTYSSVSIADDTWTHIAVSVDFSSVTDSIKMYINGTEDTSLTDGISGSFVENTTYNSSIGGTWTGVAARLFEGSIDQVRIFNTALTQAQVTTLARGIATSYSGTNTNVNFNGYLDFQPDLVWWKNRDTLAWHQLHDSVRGAGNRIFSNDDSATQFDAQSIKSFDTNGFTIGTSSDFNGDCVAWCWKAGGTAVSNTAGTITSQVSANKDSGFSIVKYTGNDVNGQSIGHGLSTSPELIIIKCLNVPEDWMVYTLPTGNAQKLYLNSSAAKAATGNMNNQTPTDDVFFVGGGTETGDLNDNYIAYCWHSVAGYSKIGTYEGLGATPVTVSGVGFKASFIIVKNIDATAHWNMYDIKRSTVANRANKILYPDLSNSEPSATNYYFEMNNDGFVVSPVNHEQLNYPNRTYIYMAIA